MAETPLSALLEAVFDQQTEPEALFQALLPAVCQVLQTDRCFLHLRNPATRIYRNICWRIRPDLPDVSTHGWEPEQEWEREDPMFAAALATKPSIFVEDIETAPPDVLSRDFERNYMKHRSLVHAHIAQDGQLWGILQPCLFEQPRSWSEFDRSVIHGLVDRLRPIVVKYVQTHTNNL